MFAIDNNQQIVLYYTHQIKNVFKIEFKKGDTMRNIPKRYQKNRKNVCFALPVKWIEELREISERYGVSFSDVARYAIQFFLKDINNAH